MQIVPVLEVTPTERQLAVVQALLDSDEYKVYVEDAQVCVRIVRTFRLHVTGFHYNVDVGCNVYKYHHGTYVCLQGALCVEERLR